MRITIIGILIYNCLVTAYDTASSYMPHNIKDFISFTTKHICALFDTLHQLNDYLCKIDMKN